MFDFLRDLTKSAEEKRQEQLTAYIDGALSQRERQRFEALLAEDPQLQADLAQRQQIKLQLRQLPRRRVPRSFMLDPAQYGAPQRQPLRQLYPALRVTTALTAVFLIIAVAADMLTGASFLMQQETAAPVAMESGAAADSDAVADEVLEYSIEEADTAAAADAFAEEAESEMAAADMADDAAADTAVQSAPVAVATPLATAVADTPRDEAAPSLSERSAAQIATPFATAVVIEAAPQGELEGVPEVTNEVEPLSATPQLSTLRLVQIVLGVLLLIGLALLYYTRRLK